jgi:hypothetical protein
VTPLARPPAPAQANAAVAHEPYVMGTDPELDSFLVRLTSFIQFCERSVAVRFPLFARARSVLLRLRCACSPLARVFPSRCRARKRAACARMRLPSLRGALRSSENVPWCHACRVALTHRLFFRVRHSLFSQHAYVKELELLKNELEQILSTVRTHCCARATAATSISADA